MNEIVDNRRNKRLLDDLGEWTPDSSKNPNRLPNIRWKIGEEPDAEGNNKEDGWVNVKLDVVEHGADSPNQNHLLSGGGPKLKLPCHICGQSTYAVASKDARELLEEAGYVNIPEFDSSEVVIAVCPAGHKQQLLSSVVPNLLAEEY